jgi:hypothetical protein
VNLGAIFNVYKTTKDVRPKSDWTMKRVDNGTQASSLKQFAQAKIIQRPKEPAPISRIRIDYSVRAFRSLIWISAIPLKIKEIMKNFRVIAFIISTAQ